MTPENPRASWEGGKSGSPTAMFWPLAVDRHSEERGTNDEQSPMATDGDTEFKLRNKPLAGHHDGNPVQRITRTTSNDAIRMTSNHCATRNHPTGRPCVIA